MVPSSFSKMAVGLSLAVIVASFVPDPALSQGRRGQVVPPAATPSSSAPGSTINETPQVRPVPTATATAETKEGFGLRVQKLMGTMIWRMLGRMTGKSDGVLVSEVLPGSPAEQLAIKKDDAILACNYRDVKSPEEFNEIFAALKPGDKVVLLIFRMSPTLLTLSGTIGQPGKTVAGADSPGSVTVAQSAGAGSATTIFAPTGTHEILAVALSPDGALIVSGGSAKDSLKLWDAATGKEIRTFTGRIDAVHAAAFSPDGRYVLAGGASHTMELWDTATGKEIRAFTGPTADDLILGVAFSPDGRLALSGGSDNTLRLWDIATGRQLRAFPGHSGWVSSIAFSPDGKLALSGSWDGSLRLWDIATARMIKSFTGPQGVVSAGSVMTKEGEKVPPAVQIVADKMVKGMTGFAGRISSVAFSPDGRLAVSASWGNLLTLWDIGTGQGIRTFTGHQERVNTVAFSPNGAQIISAGRDNTVKLWNVETGRVVRTYTGHMGDIGSIVFSRDGKRLLSGGSDGTIRLWGSQSGKEVVRFVSLKDNEWIVITPEGYYNSSGRGHGFLNVRRGDKVYVIDQFYDVFYRPDIVSAMLKGEDIRGLVTLTVEEAINNPPPTVKFASLPERTDAARLQVCYQIQSTGGGIGEVRLFQNGKLVKSDGFYREAAASTTAPLKLATLDSRAVYQDMRSLTVREKPGTGAMVAKPKGDLVEECVELDVTSGENEIGLAAFNGPNTVQSVLSTARFVSTRKPEEPHLYILAVGIDRYRDASVNLKYAAKDARDFLAQLADKTGTIYKPENIHLTSLVDEKAGKAEIMATIDRLASQVKHGDSFIFFAASHGLLLQNQYYIVTSSFDGRLDIGASLISSNEIVEVSKKVKSLSQLFIFDTCHAGGVDAIISGLYDARMSVLAKKMGLHIFASAGSVQTALDGYEGNGLYTYTLLTGLKNGRLADKERSGSVTVESLGKYSKELTSEISGKLGHPQTPLIISFGKDSKLFEVR